MCLSDITCILSDITCVYLILHVFYLILHVFYLILHVFYLILHVFYLILHVFYLILITVVFTGYSMPATSVPLRPHNLTNSMGQMGSSNSLPRSRTPKTGQNRHSEESQHSDELSNNGIESPITNTSTPDKPVFSLER